MLPVITTLLLLLILDLDEIQKILQKFCYLLWLLPKL